MFLHKGDGVRRSMRGEDERQEVVFSYVNTEQRIPADHPLRGIRALLEKSLGELRCISTGCTRSEDGRRSPRNGCCGRCC